MTDDEGLEELAGKAAAQAYQDYLLRKVAVMLASLLALVAISAGDWTWGILALWRLSHLLAALLAGLILGEFSVISWQLYRRRRPQPAGLSDGEKMTAALDSLAAARDRPEVPPWWRAGPRAVRFWRGLVIRALYSSCCGLVVAAWAGVPAGIAAGVAWTVASAALGQWSRSAAAGTMNAAAFADPRPPRDSPEI